MQVKKQQLALDMEHLNDPWEIGKGVWQVWILPTYLFSFYAEYMLSRFSHVWFVVLWTVAHQASLGFSRQEYWSGLPCHLPGIFPARDTSCEMPGWMKHKPESRLLEKYQPHQICRLYHCNDRMKREPK